MIQIEKVSKSFAGIQALDQLSLEIPEGEIFGLVGTNGAGKSTLLRMIAGILKPETGCLLVDGQEVFEREMAKAGISFISDEAWFFGNSTPMEIGAFYAMVYNTFDRDRYRRMLGQFKLDGGRRIQTFSKGMKKQLSLILGLCAGTKYLLCDETFDGLDPVMRQAVKSLIASESLTRDFTPIIASHNLRELEDICERVGLLHKGKILLARELEEMKRDLHKVQCVIRNAAKEEALLGSLETLHVSRQGSLMLITARGSREEIEQVLAAAEPVFYEIIPLSLEEIFISETEGNGYEIKDLIC